MEDSQEEKRWEEKDASFDSDMSAKAPATTDKNTATGADHPHHAHNLVNPLDAAAGNEAERQLLLQQYQQLTLAQQKVALARQYFDTIMAERNVLDEKFNGKSSFLPDDEYDAQRKKLASLKVTATALLWAAMQEAEAVKQQTHPAVLAAMTATTSAAAGNQQYNNNALTMPSLSSSGQQTFF